MFRAHSRRTWFSQRAGLGILVPEAALLGNAILPQMSHERRAGLFNTIGTLLSYAERQVTVEIRTRAAVRHRAPDDLSRHSAVG
jgi:hypothetical protein